MNVRLKKESSHHSITSNPLNTGEEITLTEFKEWLDAGKEVPYSIPATIMNVGTFETAMESDIKSFRDFPRAVSEMPDDLKDTPVVMFCTGGIRWRRRAWMLDAGFTNVKVGRNFRILKRSVAHIGMGLFCF